MVASEYVSGLETFSNLLRFIQKATSALLFTMVGQNQKQLVCDMLALLIKNTKNFYANSAPVDNRRYGL